MSTPQPPGPARRRCSRTLGAQRGQALLLVIGVLVLAGVVCLAIVRIGVAAGERARAETAADAAALAGAADGPAAATAAAQANGGVLTSLRSEGADVVVAVRVGRVVAQARARVVPAPPPPRQ
ncbi:MAG: hypothetical protein JWL73_2448, partial [Actinomycetia bacterium]|nr:hypothetical protein [Actinomycetes bacterium]